MCKMTTTKQKSLDFACQYNVNNMLISHFLNRFNVTYFALPGVVTVELVVAVVVSAVFGSLSSCLRPRI